MSLCVKPYTFAAGATIIAAEHNSDFDTIYNEFNGNITDSNIKSTAAIADTKLAQIATASKVAGTALTSFAGIPSSAGYIPDNNMGIASGIWTGGFAASNTGTVTVLGLSSAGYYYKMGKAVSISGKFTVASLSTGAGGNLLLNGLPFASGPSSWHMASVSVYATAISANPAPVMAYITTGSTTITLQRMSTAGIGTGMVADVNSGSIFMIGGTYFTN